MKIWKLHLFLTMYSIVLLITFANGSDPCDTFGCEEACIYRGTGQPQCACPCGYDVDTDNKTCIASTVCEKEILVFINFGSQIQALDCSIHSITGVDSYSANFQNYKNDIKNFLNFIRSDVGKPTNRVSVVLFSKRSEPNVLTTYTESDIDAVISYIDAQPRSDCNSSSAWTIDLLRLLQRDPATYTGADDYNGDTSKVATTAFVLAPYYVKNSLSTLLIKKPIDFVDSLTVIQYDPVLDGMSGLFPTEDPLKYHRKIACNNPNEPCDNVFFFKKPNNFGKSLTEDNVVSRISKYACLDRQVFGPIILNSTNVFDKSSALFPTCRIFGLQCGDLQVGGSNLPVCDFSSSVSDGLLVQIPLLAANTAIEIQQDSDTIKVSNMIQAVSETGKSYPPVNVKCEAYFKVSRVPYSYSASVTKTATAEEFFGSLRKVYSDANLTNEATGNPIKYEIGKQVYLSTVARSLPDGVFTRIWEVSSQDSKDKTPLQYVTEGSLPRFSPNVIITDNSSEVTEFRIKMFEMVSTMNSEQRSLITFQTVIAQCTASVYNKFCRSSRKKRYADESQSESRQALSNMNIFVKEPVITNKYIDVGSNTEKKRILTLGENLILLVIFAILARIIVPKKKLNKSAPDYSEE